MKRTLIALSTVILLALIIGSYVIGYRGGASMAREQMYQVYLDMAGASLASAQAPEANYQTKEYAKAQFYYYAYLSQRNIYLDLGPVDLKTIAGLEPFIRHADSPNDYYNRPQKAEQGAAANP